jgi:hypothetical protein
MTATPSRDQQTTTHSASNDNLARAIDRVRTASETLEKGAFTSRVLNALARVVSEADEQWLLAATGAASDFDVLLQILERPDVLPMLDDGPLASAKLRGLRLRESLLNAEGGIVSSTGAADILGISRQAVDKRRKAGRLIGLSLGRRGYAYPVWQFDPKSGTLPGLEDVLAALEGLDPWMQAAFILNPSVRLDGATPLQSLRQGEVESVLVAAQAFGEQGAA